MSGTAIAQQAVSALHDPAFVDVPGCCQRFARQVAEAVGGTVGAEMDEYRSGSALGTMLAFQGTEFNVWDNVDSDNGDIPDDGFIQEGDFLYKGSATSGPAGHVGIVFNGKRVGETDGTICIAENSSYHENPAHMGNVEGAKGWRTLEAFGNFEMVVRLK